MSFSVTCAAPEEHAAGTFLREPKQFQSDAPPCSRLIGVEKLHNDPLAQESIASQNNSLWIPKMEH